MEPLTLPEALDLDSSNFANTLRQWRKCLQPFTLASGLSAKDAKI